MELVQSQFSDEERTRVARMDSIANWLALVCSIILANLVDFALEFHNFPELARKILFSVLIIGSWVLGHHLSRWNLRRLNLVRAIQEKRVIHRTNIEPKSVADTDLIKVRSLRQKLHRLVIPIFIVAWAFFLGLFQFGSIGFESEFISGYAFLALIPALIITLFYSYLTQEPLLKWISADDYSHYDKFLKKVLWSQITQVEEVKNWNPKQKIFDCQFVFRNEKGKLWHKIGVPLSEADAVFARIQARLTKQNCEINS